jgi:ornithine decarboxylase
MRKKYYTDAEWKKFASIALQEDTPFLAINLDIVEKKFKSLQNEFSFAHIYYAIKANPKIEIIQLLHKLGSNFDVASVYEMRTLLDLGITPDKISFGNTIKKAKDIKEAYQKGIRLFVTDSINDLNKIAANAPGSRVFFRILVEGSQTAEWPLSRKFGCHPEMAVDLIIQAQELGLEPFGVSFHVGSQQHDIGSWDSAIAKVKYIFDKVYTENNIKLKMINLGGGFPANYVTRINDSSLYAKEILRFLQEDFDESLPEVYIEPGRAITADAGVIVSEIVMISKKTKTALNRWIYTDIGKFGGLIETLEESIKYPIYYEKQGELEEVVLAGPTCDSQDIMYENNMYKLPVDLEEGDKLYWLSTGAYTSTYSAVCFNGFPPLRTVFV